MEENKSTSEGTVDLQKVEKKQSTGNQNLSFNLEHYPAGMYIVEWQMEQGKGLIRVVKQ